MHIAHILRCHRSRGLILAGTMLFADSVLWAESIAAQGPARLSEYESWSLVWYAISALSAAATLLVVFYAAVIGVRQIREAARARQLGSALAILKYVESPELRRARKLLYSRQFCEELRNRVPRIWSETAMNTFLKEVSSEEVDWVQFRTWLAALETMSILVLHDLAPDEIVNLYFGKGIRHHWDILQPLITSLRAYYGGSDFLQHVEMLDEFMRRGGFRRSS